MIKGIAIPSIIVLCASELIASAWVWNSFPTDSVRVHYPGYWNYEAVRFGIWLAILTAGFAALVIYRRKKGGHAKEYHPLHGFRSWVMALCGGLVVESTTSGLYWLTPRSIYIRYSYGYWDTPPPARDLASSFVGYWRDHAIAWGAVVLLGSLIWLACSKLRRKRQLAGMPAGAQH
jgi:hypothetical protein